MQQRKPDGGPRWPRGQKFLLSLAGREACEAHRQAVIAARGLSRAALDAALAAWAAPRQVQAGDGVLLGEMIDGPRGLPELTRAFEHAGTSAAEVRASLSRLVDAGLVDAIPTSRDTDTPAFPVRWGT